MLPRPRPGRRTGIAELVHQLRPRLRDAADVPPELDRLAGEAVTRQGRQHEVERVFGGAAVRGRIGEWSTVSSSSITEPGQPCVTTSGSAFSYGERTWMKWISTPS